MVSSHFTVFFHLPLSLHPLLWGCSMGITLNTPPQSEGVQGWSSPASDAELPPAGPGPARPSPVETFPVRVPGPWPGCKEPFAGYLQSIISHVITSLVLGSSTDTSGAAATTATPLGWGGTGGAALEPG